MSAVYSETLAKREQEVESLTAEIASLEQQEHEAVSEALRTAPTRRPFGDLTSPASKIRRKREKAEKMLAGLLEEIPLLREHAVTAAREQAEKSLDRYEKELRSVEGVQPEAWSAIKADYVALVRKYASAKAGVVQAQKRINDDALAAAEGYGLREEWERRFNATQVRELPASWVSARNQLEQSLADDEPELHRALREGSPATWTPTGMGAALGGRTAEFGAGVIVNLEENQ